MALPVIFRYDKDPMPAWDPVFAIFPTIIANNQGMVTIYQHCGQHSAGELNACLAMSRKATAQEAIPLLNELKSIGYQNLVITDKIKTTL